MSTLVIVALVAAAGVVLFNVLIDLPPRGTLDKLRPSSKFKGFVLFGKDGAYVTFYQRPSGDCIAFRKRYRDDRQWDLEIAVRGPGVSNAFVSEFARDVAALDHKFNVGSGMHQGTNEVTFFVTGVGVKDPNALENLTRIVGRRLGHSRNAKYKLDYLGPTDYDAVDRYFEEQKKEWRGDK